MPSTDAPVVLISILSVFVALAVSTLFICMITHWILLCSFLSWNSCAKWGSGFYSWFGLKLFPIVCCLFILFWLVNYLCCGLYNSCYCASIVIRNNLVRISTFIADIESFEFVHVRSLSLFNMENGVHVDTFTKILTQIL